MVIYHNTVLLHILGMIAVDTQQQVFKEMSKSEEQRLKYSSIAIKLYNSPTFPTMQHNSVQH